MKYYNNAKQFAESIKKERYEYEQVPEDIQSRLAAIRKQYHEILHDEDLNSILNKEFDAINTKFQEVVDCILIEFLDLIQPPFKDLFLEHFYFTTVDTKSINAHIARSKDKKYFGVFINSALIMLLTKVGKLNSAIADPNCVIYCNRFPSSRPSHSDLVEMRNEMYLYFTQYKMAHGPFLILNGKSAVVHFVNLNIQEKFIVFHEIAHFLNGDLFADLEQKLIYPFSNLNYQREHLADLLAFALLLKSENKKIELNRTYIWTLILAIIDLFNIMYGLQSAKGEKHPHPLDRMNVIVEGYFGIEVADLIEETYYDQLVWVKLKNYDIQLNFEMNKINFMIDELLTKAFESSNWT